jgi:hypothetical protein
MGIQRPSEQLWPHASPKRSVPRGTPRNHELFARLEADLFLANQLFRRGHTAFLLQGLTTPDQRRERLRQAILTAELQEDFVMGGPRGSAAETLSQAFKRLYGVDL